MRCNRSCDSPRRRKRLGPRRLRSKDAGGKQISNLTTLIAGSDPRKPTPSNRERNRLCFAQHRTDEGCAVAARSAATARLPQDQSSERLRRLGRRDRTEPTTTAPSRSISGSISRGGVAGRQVDRRRGDRPRELRNRPIRRSISTARTSSISRCQGLGVRSLSPNPPQNPGAISRRAGMPAQPTVPTLRRRELATLAGMKLESLRLRNTR